MHLHVSSRCLAISQPPHAKWFVYCAFTMPLQHTRAETSILSLKHDIDSLVYSYIYCSHGYSILRSIQYLCCSTHSITVQALNLVMHVLVGRQIASTYKPHLYQLWGLHSTSPKLYVYQLKKIYGSKCPGYRLLMISSGCTIAA